MTNTSSAIVDKWDDAKASQMDEVQKLLYRSNLLGSDKRVTNYGGGNTSVKIAMNDPLTGEQVDVLWVKGSGGDIGSIQLDGFATLYLDKLKAMKGLYKGADHEDEMVGLLPHATFNLNPRPASIDTPLHAFVPYKHVDHVHPDSVIAIAAAQNSQEITLAIFGDKIGWLPWRRPGFELGLWLEDFVINHPEAIGVILESHGLFTWADDAKLCYERTIETINTATSYIEKQAKAHAVFGGADKQSLPFDQAQNIAAELMLAIRSHINKDGFKVGHFDNRDIVLEFVNSKDLSKLAPLGTSCPDHFLRTKICPLVIDFDPQKNNIDEVVSNLGLSLKAYRDHYRHYYERCKHSNSPTMRDPNPVIYLVPGVGLISFAVNKTMARHAAEFYINAINVMRGAETLSTYRGLPEQEAFNIEYWLLEEAKLQRMPKPKALEGRIAYITGGAGGIGKASAHHLAREGACIVVADIDANARHEAIAELSAVYGEDRIFGAGLDVVDEASVKQSFITTVLAFGGVDIVISNAGISSAAPFDETSLAVWNRNMSILATGYFLVAREGFSMLKKQNSGGSIVFVGSKNGLAASAGASAYCAAKATEIHLARCIALEGAPFGIRCNVVNPDAVIRGSRIWNGEWRQQRAQANHLEDSELEDYYRQRSLLKRSVLPEDVAEAIAFFGMDVSSKSTGNIINVDAGNAATFTR
ncbi:bifunctional rhamnulose-1-phosphate aldolase/short-chain dehydrogenase [Bartonella sp. HY329]|uniref:bifunctional rhamnulose-1-phosphate aldolase/short-chain dehydrogenase n=1 Tax=unclassified Bartonella TaxID=2645622 RepID=UPI0021C78710|nr:MULTISPECIES: bifunctional rhamnulose-1-phosphate aldolase/short-chain dehydrogenase [unclassified Bartonella]UXM94903.1 bifunctional rhamnulose-1-phosphate aldolase/short-chain dehydrogenase [Bartonella sp. HY329]UXN09226.1 bifunctional rhamnulose-1-phosphate aldolase/short-chain dehydrogenase [Bartonella sp. HY328]